MEIEWTKVTWYSGFLAFILIFGIFFVGVRIGQYKIKIQSQIEEMTSVSDQWAKTSSTPSSKSSGG
jgi:uncharacterized membrane-anchored protein YhcB (DUF1043 family)